VTGAPGQARHAVAPGQAGKVTSSLFDPVDAVSVPAPTNGATVSVGGGRNGDDGCDDDDVDVPPFMRH
jgi:cell division protein FtsZ